MEKRNILHFVYKTLGKKEHFPLSGQLELTYRCPLDCIHCYCKGSEDRGKELTTVQWKGIIDTLREEGCIWLNFTGGDPLLRADFLELYSYAKEKGFIVTIFTNGYLFTEKIISHLVKMPPLAVEITLNGITRRIYESITQVKGSFGRVIKNIKSLAKTKIKLILKSNCLQQNKHEVPGIKAWTEELLGKPADQKFRFKYGTLVDPRLDGDTTPCGYRLSFEELVEFKKQDRDIWECYQEELRDGLPAEKRDKAFLYRCNSWKRHFLIDPFGRLKTCTLGHRVSVDLKTGSFRDGFYNVFPRLLDQKFKTDSKCRHCGLRSLCYVCPPRAYLETGNEEAPVPYYCRLAQEQAKAMVH